ncbi:MAG: MFS transporter [Rhodospirillaceae bacterium]
MTASLAPIAALLLSVAFLLTGNGLLGTLLPIRASIEMFSTLEIGILGSSYYLGFAAGCIFGPRLVHRVGHIRAFTAMVAIVSAAALVHAMVSNPLIWWLLRAATGFCFAALFVIIESWLNERSTNTTRGTIFSIYTIINLSVITLGQLMIILYDPATFSLFAIASILVSIAAVPVAMSVAQAPNQIESTKIRIPHLFKLSPVGFCGCLVVGLANGSFWALGPIFAQQSGMRISDIAIFMSVTVIAGALSQWPLGRMSDTYDRRTVILGVCLGGVLSGIFMILFGQTWESGILVFSFFFGAFALPLYAISVAHTNDFAAPEDYVEVGSGLLLAYAVGAVIGPFVASGFMTYAGPNGLFGFTVLVHAALAVFTVYSLRMHARPPEDARATFNESLLIANTTSAINPASEQSSTPETSRS